MLEKSLNIFLDFLFPKADEVLNLESLSSGELLHTLPEAKSLENNHISLFDYKDERVRTLIWELKYKGNRKIAKTLAEILSDVLKTEILERAFTENFRDPLLIPVPISSERRLERGYNQIEILAEEIKKLDTENLFTYDPNILFKTVHTDSQTKTHRRSERMKNIHNSMEAHTVGRKNKCAIVLDDVTTTGATFKEATRALKASGVNKVLCMSVAH